MIKAVFEKKGFSISGHADYDEYGKDVVCAGVSSMAQFAAYILKAYGAHVKKEKGYLEVTLSDVNKHARIVIDTLKRALQDIQRKFPDHLKVEVI